MLPIIQTRLSLILTLTLLCSISACASSNAHMHGNSGLPEISAATFEKDRQSILAMSGEYTVDFQFRETVSLQDGYQLTTPYLSAATEIVEVIEDTGKRIDMQHILLLKDNGRIVKHWRQTWIYEPTMVYEFKGHNTWTPRHVGAQERRGAWAQIVYQVDDSPRYSGVGRWVHHGNLSSWESDTWRPLPRREYTKRNDYQVLLARNRHTLTPTGWVHEQDNHKLILGEETNPIISREVGLNVYTKTSEVDFSPVHTYWKGTKAYWADVREAWSKLMNGERTLKLKASWQDKKLFMYLFELAKEVNEQKANRETWKEKLSEILEGFVVDVDGPEAKATAEGNY